MNAISRAITSCDNLFSYSLLAEKRHNLITELASSNLLLAGICIGGAAYYGPLIGHAIWLNSCARSLRKAIDTNDPEIVMNWLMDNFYTEKVIVTGAMSVIYYRRDPEILKVLLTCQLSDENRSLIFSYRTSFGRGAMYYSEILAKERISSEDLFDGLIEIQEQQGGRNLVLPLLSVNKIRYLELSDKERGKMVIIAALNGFSDLVDEFLKKGPLLIEEQYDKAIEATQPTGQREQQIEEIQHELYPSGNLGYIFDRRLKELGHPTGPNGRGRLPIPPQEALTKCAEAIVIWRDHYNSYGYQRANAPVK